MPLSHEPAGSKILAEIEIYSLTRAELICSLCYEIPCSSDIGLYANQGFFYNKKVDQSYFHIHLFYFQNFHYYLDI